MHRRINKGDLIYKILPSGYICSPEKVMLIRKGESETDTGTKISSYLELDNGMFYTISKKVKVPEKYYLENPEIISKFADQRLREEALILHSKIKINEMPFSKLHDYVQYLKNLNK